MADPLGRVWKNSDYVSSNGETIEIPLKDLTGNRNEPCGAYVCVSGTKRLKGDFKCEPFAANSKKVRECFAQTQAYYTLDSYFRFLGSNLGLDMRTAMVLIDGSFKTIPVVVNERELDNALYDPQSFSLHFGSADGKFQYASDSSIVVHEATHLIIDKINPRLSQGIFNINGFAIHEGCADAMAALLRRDSKIGKDFQKFRMGKDDGGSLRNVNNKRTFQDMPGFSGEHDIGEVYGGFFWSLYQRFSKPAFGMGREKARSFVMNLILTHLGTYRVENPEPADFLRAVQDAASLLVRYANVNVNLDLVDREILAEGKERGFHLVAETGYGTGGIPPAPMPVFAAPVTSSKVFGVETKFHQQLHRTAKHGSVPVLGHGATQRTGEAVKNMKGVRNIPDGSISEEVSIARERAAAVAIDAIMNDLPARLSPRMKERISNQAIETIQRQGAAAGKLAVPPKGTNLVWSFEAGPVHVAVDAKTGEVTMMNLRVLVD